jgi:hypothetical protein
LLLPKLLTYDAVVANEAVPNKDPVIPLPLTNKLPVITALPENGNALAFAAYEAVTEKLDEISYSEPVRSWPGLNCLDIISISHL